MQRSISSNLDAGEFVALDRMRSNRAGYLACTQNLASIHSVMQNHAHASRLISLFSNQVHMSNTCVYTSDHVATLMGTKTKRTVQYSNERPLAPPLLLGRETYRKRKKQNGVIVPHQAPRVNAADLARLPTGQFWFRLASGRVVKGRGKLVS